MKKLLIVLFTVGVLSVVGIGNVSAAEYYIDNDSNVSGYHTSRTGPWSYYDASYCYYGTYRITYTVGATYSWWCDSPTYRIHGASTYLNHGNFTGTGTYKVGGVISYQKAVNQDTAYGGWNTLYLINGGFDAYAFSIVLTNSSSSSAKGVGADAIYLRDR